MKKIIAVMLMMAAAFSLFAAGNKEQSPLPDFVVNPPVAEDAIYGVGFANQARTDQSLVTAKMRARADIARQLEVQIQSAMTDYFQQAGMSENAQTLEFVESITREITNKKLTHTMLVKTEQQRDGGIWVMISYDKAAAVAAFEESAANFVRNEEAAFSEFKAREAAKMLDKLLESQPTSSEAVTQ